MRPEVPGAVDEKSRCLGKANICVMTFPFSKEDAYFPPLLKDLLKVLDPLSGSICLISGEMSEELGGRVALISIKRPSGSWFSVPPQVQMSLRLVQASRRYDVVLFYLMFSCPLPVLAARLLGKRTIQVIAGSEVRSAKATYRGKLFGLKSKAYSLLFGIREWLSSFLSHQIVVESVGLIPYYGLEGFKTKIIATGALPIDMVSFQVRKGYATRDTLVGYIGRLAPVKGVMNLVKAIPFILKERKDIRFLIGGDGPLREEIERYLNASGVRDNVELTGWLQPENFAERLNALKLFVLPSYSEGLPVTPLQAMACGTPVLATPVGGVPDIITDGETGFLIRENSPQGVAREVIRALASPRLEDVARRVRPLVEERYSYEATVERFRKVLYGERA